MDCRTGDLTVLGADLVVDVGRSLNPAIDIGQIEGAFVMGIGYTHMEQLLIAPGTGEFLTTGPGAYPGVTLCMIETNNRGAENFLLFKVDSPSVWKITWNFELELGYSFFHKNTLPSKQFLLRCFFLTVGLTLHRDFSACCWEMKVLPSMHHIHDLDTFPGFFLSLEVRPRPPANHWISDSTILANFRNIYLQSLSFPNSCFVFFFNFQARTSSPRLRTPLSAST